MTSIVQDFGALVGLPIIFAVAYVVLYSRLGTKGVIGGAIALIVIALLIQFLPPEQTPPLVRHSFEENTAFGVLLIVAPATISALAFLALAKTSRRLTGAAFGAAITFAAVSALVVGIGFASLIA